MQDIPSEDTATYAMLSRADSVGVFQVESRAQMSMLPRLKPTCFYDLVVQVAIVRPGPIQGGMVHPYLQRRQGLAPVTYPSAALKEALGRTLGVPIFQEQVMQIAMLAAGFSADEADQLRRSMAAWKRKGGVHKFYERIVSGMVAHGHTVAFAQDIFKQIEGFGEYGFPESHAASFALLVYVSAWMKCHEPACFLAALLNSLPMGFYGPSQLVQDAQRHGVQVHPVDVLHSTWDCRLEGADYNTVRLGLCLVAGLPREAGARIEHANAQRPFTDIEDLAARAQLNAAALGALAGADALHALAGHRRLQVWHASAAHLHTPLLSGHTNDDLLHRTSHDTVQDTQLDTQLDARKHVAHQTATHAWQAHTHITEPTLGEHIALDYNSTALSLRGHPVALLRDCLSAQRIQSAQALQLWRNGRLAKACGLVTVRQKPGTAKGVLFITLEDETGVVNVVVWQSVQLRQRDVVLHAQLMAVYGVWQRDTDPATGQPGRVSHLVAQHVVDMTPQLHQATASKLSLQPHEFH
jgi:error-prone DNA polymerase